jgi:sugar phosphate isomerase/epimerase
MPETPDRDRSIGEMARLHLDRLGTIARLMERYGIRIGLEVIGVESFRTGRGKPFVARLGDLDRMLGAIWDESPNLGVLVDAFHLYAADEPIEAGLAWGVDRIVWVHVADLPPDGGSDRSAIIDANRGLPGDNGSVDVKSFLAEMHRQGYEGPVTAEPLSNCGSLIGRTIFDQVRQTKLALDRVWPES